MMKRSMLRRKLFLLVGLLACCVGAQAQVSVRSTIDSMAIFIGETTGIRLEVTTAKNAKVELPRFDSLQQMVAGVEVLGSQPVDTQWIDEGKRMQLSKHYTITSFDSSLYYLPPLIVKVNGDTFPSNSLALKVLTLDVDTLHEDNIFGLRSVMAPPFEWKEYRSLLLLAVLVLLITVLLLYIIIRLKDNKPIIRRIRTKRKLPPFEAAMQRIEQIKQERTWQKEDSKEYYTQLTDTLRQYMNERYGFNATEMTTAEIIAHLQAVNDEQSIRELRDLFETADLVKFAKYSTPINENDRHLVSAIEYIRQTKPEEPVAVQPPVVVVVDKRSKSMKRWLTVGIIVAVVALLLLVAYMIYRIYLLS